MRFRWNRIRRRSKHIASSPTPPSTKTRSHSSPLTHQKQYSRTDSEGLRRTDHRHAQAAEGARVTELSPSPTNAEGHAQTDRESTKMDQGSEKSLALHSRTLTNAERYSQKDEENPQMLRGLPQVTETSPARVNIEDLRADDIVIAVMGPTGSGRSTFICSASGRNTHGVGHTLKSCTSEVLGTRFWDKESGRYVVLVDTPGFDDTYGSDLDILNMVSDWLNSSYNNDILLSAILYLHRITDNRMASTPLKNLRAFQKLCGRDALAKVYLTTTMWDEVEPKVGKRRLNELKTEYWKTMIAHGAKIACCRSDDDSPKKLIRRILAKECARKVRLQKEMAELQMELTASKQAGPAHVPTPPSSETEAHSSPPTSKKKYSCTDEAHRRMDHEHAQAAEETRMTELSPPPTNSDKYIRTDKESAEMDQWCQESVALDSRTNLERHSQKDEGNARTVQGPPQVAEKPPAIVNVEDLRTDDIVIAVMGPTGSGRSTFIRSASGYDTQGIGHTLKSCTSEVLGIRFWDQASGRYVVLVDTPGFDDTYKSDLDILNMISDWLNSSYNKNILLSAILYLHRITDNRMAGTPLKNLRVFRKLCGRDALAKVYLTTTMWDEVDPEVGERRLDELKTDYWKVMITHGAQVARCRSDDDSPKDLIRRILSQESPRMLQLQREMAQLKMELEETEAGQQLYPQLETLVERQTELLRRLDKERKAAAEPRVLADLQTEYNDLRTQIDDRLRQMEELKLPRLKSFRHLVSWRPDWWPL